MQARERIHTVVPLTLLIPLIILIEGFASIAVEILTIRQLLPVAGGSVIVTSLIIGIFLLFLALGYEKGGRVKDNLHRVLRLNFFIAGVWSGIGLSYIFIIWFFSLVQDYTGTHVVYPLISYLLLVLSPTVYLLGQTLPITMNIVKQNHTAGVIAGRALGLSTIGSFLGAVLTTLLFMHYLGVAWTVFIVFISLIALSLFLSQTTTSLILKLVLAIASGTLVYLTNVSAEKKLFLLTNNYANYQVFDSSNSRLKDGQRLLMINDVFSSYLDKNNNAFEYAQILRKIMFEQLKFKNADILILGAGGFSLSQGDTSNSHFTYVDIDSRLKDVVVPRFVEKVQDKLVVDDARNFLNTNKEKYDLILSDVFSDYRAIPAHLLTREFMQKIREHLKPKGYAAFNIIANPTYKDAYSKRIDNTIRSVFKSCAVIPTSYADNVSNIIYVCANYALNKDKTVYVDNLNTSTTDSFEW